MSTDERLLKLLRATPDQQAAIDGILDGKMEAPRRAPTGPLLMMMGAGASLLGVSRATLWRMIKLGKLEREEILPGTFRVRRADVELLAQGHQAEGRSAESAEIRKAESRDRGRRTTDDRGQRSVISDQSAVIRTEGGEKR